MKNEDTLQDKRCEIIDAAELIFTTRGFTAARMDDIAERAGVAKGTLYLYFSSKQELFVSLLEERAKQYVTNLRGWLEDVDSLEEFIQILARLRGQLFIKNQRLVESISHSVPDFSKDLQRRVWDLRKSLEQPTTDALARLLPPEYPVATPRAAAVVNGAIDYTVASYLLYGDSVVLDDVARDIQYVLLPGLSQRESNPAS